MWLTLSDIIWPSPFFFYSFFIHLSQGQCFQTYFDPSPSFLICLCSRQSSIFSDIFWGFPLLFSFLVCFDGALPYFFSFLVCFDRVDALWHNMTVSLLFLSFLSNYHKVNVLRHILTLPPLFWFFCLVVKVQFSVTCFGGFPYFFFIFGLFWWGLPLLFFISCLFWWSWCSLT